MCVRSGTAEVETPEKGDSASPSDQAALKSAFHLIPTQLLFEPLASVRIIVVVLGTRRD